MELADCAPCSREVPPRVEKSQRKRDEERKGKTDTRVRRRAARGASPCRTQNFDLEISSVAFSNYSARGNFNSTLIYNRNHRLFSLSLLANSVCMAKQDIYSAHFVLCACSYSTIISTTVVMYLRTDQVQSVLRT